MGQDTYVNAGVSVSMPFTFENRKHIYYLLQESLNAYVQRKQDYDEIYDIKYEYNFFNDEENNEDKDENNKENNNDDENNDDQNNENKSYCGFSLPSESFLKKVSMMEDEKEFDDKSGRYKQLTFIFLYPFLDASVRNISRRSHPHIFEQSFRTPDYLIQTIQKGRELFLKVGVPSNLIQIGCSIRDST